MLRKAVNMGRFMELLLENRYLSQGFFLILDSYSCMLNTSKFCDISFLIFTENKTFDISFKLCCRILFTASMSKA